ncbi:hypothetical protein XAUC_10850 [Xanthomonas citri pv. aurantifolii str. ICPB 10535]|nr:hypothetical protein XAUC_10850 [Xanthomonas citri pv. aurantifolii str. ICPB 10535]
MTSSSRTNSAGVTVEGVDEQTFIGDTTVQAGRHRQFQFQRLQFDRAPFRASQAAHQAEFDVFLRLQLEGQAVRHRVLAVGAFEQPVRHRLERHHDAGGALGQTLAGAQVERHAGPAPVIDMRGDGDKGFHVAAFRRVVGLRRLAVNAAGGVAAAHAVVRGVLGGHRAQGAQHLDLLIADAVGFQRGGRLHCYQAQQLQDMALHHVAQGAGAGVVGVTPVNAFAFGDQDLHRLDVGPVPDRLQQRVAEAQRNQILHRRLAQVMVQAEHAVFVDQRADRLQDVAGAVRVVADRFFQHQSMRCRQRATQRQALAGTDVQAGRDRQIAHTPTAGQFADRVGHRIGIAQIHRAIVDPL